MSAGQAGSTVILSSMAPARGSEEVWKNNGMATELLPWLWHDQLKGMAYDPGRRQSPPACPPDPLTSFEK